MNVIVVPETEEFKLDVSHNEEIWINLNLGMPKLKERNVQYVAPFWITSDFVGVNRIYHIKSTYLEDSEFVITLGNSFILSNTWTGMGQNRRFEYHELESFGLKELYEGILIPSKQKI